MIPLPPELSKYESLSDLTYRGNSEWSAAHPNCPEGTSTSKISDRFRLFGPKPGLNAGAWCRRCGHFEWANDEKPTPEMSAQAAEIRAKLAQEESERLRKRIKELNRQAYWRGYHDAMRDIHREEWRKHGISDNLQDYFQLGYVPSRTFYNDGVEFSSPAMTIPIFDKGWEAINIQYRIIEPPVGVGKYRFTAGLPAPLYVTDPDNGIGGRCLLVEGAKKAIVSYANVGHEFDTVVAIPSKTPSEKLVHKLDCCSELFLALDPDAMQDGSADRIADIVGGKVYFVSLPAKPDDLFVEYNISPKRFMNYVQLARI